VNLIRTRYLRRGCRCAIDDTFVGRKAPITSEVFCVACGPPGGGGGGTTTGPAILAFVDAFDEILMFAVGRLL